jgi:PAS domain S-box-containing protein
LNNNINNPRSINLYRIFAQFYISDLQTIKELAKRTSRIQDLISYYIKNNKKFTEAHLFDENSTLIEVSGNQETLGLVIKVNHGAEKLLGWSKDNLEHNNIKGVLPDVIAKYHDDYLRQFIVSGKRKFLYREVSLYVLHKNGYIIPTKILVKPMLDLINGNFVFYSYFQEVKENFMWIITNMHGKIENIDINIGEKLGFDPKNISDKNIPIQVLCPRLNAFYSNEASLDLLPDNSGLGNSNEGGVTKNISPIFQEPLTPRRESGLPKRGGPNISGLMGFDLLGTRLPQ